MKKIILVLLAVSLILNIVALTALFRLNNNFDDFRAKSFDGVEIFSKSLNSVVVIKKNGELNGKRLYLHQVQIPFHVLDRGNNHQTVFRNEADFIYFLKLLEKYKKELKFKLYHLCLMPNHIHLMMEPTVDSSLSRIMMRLTLAYSSYFNRKYHGVGHVWQGRYKSSIIDRENRVDPVFSLVFLGGVVYPSYFCV